jgi:hypothetical protein
MSFDCVFGETTFKNVVDCLKVDCKIDVGFCSQKIGSNKKSATSTAIILYVLKTLKLLNEAEEHQYRDELLSFQICGGHYDGAFGIEYDITTWSTSQACLAIEALGGSDLNLKKAIEWLCKAQNENGGWSFNGKNDLTTRIEYCLYPLLALKKYPHQNEQTICALVKGLSFVHEYNPTSTFAKIVKLFLLKKIYDKDTAISEEREALRSLRRDILRDFDGDKIVDSDEIHFYVDFYLPSYYLLTRAFAKPDNPLSLYLIKVLQDSLIETKGWSPPQRYEPYSWTTALSLLTISFWLSDCRKHGINIIDAKNKLNLIKKGDVAVQPCIERCPLNGGLCNKTDEINREYSDDKIFLDIPYCSEYLTFEEELLKIIKKNGLIPIMAKDAVKSKALLCKICALIQECKYGLADVSYPTHNIPFELGFLLGLSRNCVILKKKDAPIPSDISGLEYVEYQNTAELRTKLSKWIKDNK